MVERDPDKSLKNQRRGELLHGVDGVVARDRKVQTDVQRKLAQEGQPVVGHERLQLLELPTTDILRGGWVLSQGWVGLLWVWAGLGLGIGVGHRRMGLGGSDANRVARRGGSTTVASPPEALLYCIGAHCILYWSKPTKQRGLVPGFS